MDRVCPHDKSLSSLPIEALELAAPALRTACSCPSNCLLLQNDKIKMKNEKNEKTSESFVACTFFRTFATQNHKT